MRVVKKFKASSTAGTLTLPEPSFIKNDSSASNVGFTATPADAFYTKFSVNSEISDGLIGSPELCPDDTQTGLTISAKTGFGDGATCDLAMSGSDVSTITIDSVGDDYRGGDRITFEARSGRLEIGTDLLARVGDTTPLGADLAIEGTATLTQDTTGATCTCFYRIINDGGTFTIVGLSVTTTGQGFRNNIACTIPMENTTGTFDVSVTPLFADQSLTEVEVAITRAHLVDSVTCSLDNGHSTPFKVNDLSVTGTTNRTLTAWTDERP